MKAAMSGSTPLTFEDVTTGQMLIGGSFLLVGWMVEERTGAASARIVMRDGQTAGGQYRIPVTLAPSESARDVLPGMGIIFESGLFVDVTAGTVSGTMLVVPIEIVRDERGLAVVGQRRPGEWVDLGSLD